VIAYTLYLISGPIRFAASDDDAKRLATEFQAHNDEVVRLRAEVERLRADAELYRWLRGGSDVPSHSLRWPRWEVRRWDGRYWQTLFGKQIDDLVAADIERDRLSIDAARAAQGDKT